MSSRECGDCQLCCTLLAVRERGHSGGKPYAIDKPAGERCAHQCAAGCALYRSEALPTVCLVFECEWRRGRLPEGERPDRSGVVVTIRARDEELWAVVFGGEKNSEDFELPASARRTISHVMGWPVAGIRLASAVIEPGKCAALHRTAGGWKPAAITYPPELEWTEGDAERKALRALVPKGPLPHGGYDALLQEKGAPWCAAQRERRRP